MCLILLSYKSHPTYKLIVAANRDEFYERRTANARFWKDDPQVLAGRDLEAGGTWMGLTKSGKISMLTNHRDLSNIKPNAPSRGHLVANFLMGNEKPGKYLQKIAEKGNAYNGFNLICGNVDHLFYYGNYQGEVHKIQSGLHGLSNALLDTAWPKVIKGLKKFEALEKKEYLEPTELFEALYDDIKAADNLLPDTGVGMEKEKMLSPMFIKSPDYGSRCSTIVLVNKKNHVQFVERSYNINDYSYSDVKFQFDF